MLLIKTHQNGHGGIVISVEDTGPGIDPAKMSTIFDKFVSTKVKGMGLGQLYANRLLKVIMGN